MRRAVINEVKVFEVDLYDEHAQALPSAIYIGYKEDSLDDLLDRIRERIRRRDKTLFWPVVFIENYYTSQTLSKRDALELSG